jgi:hypothetical protein
MMFAAGTLATLVVQLMHWLPLAPHALVELPGWQVPLQQPPLHGLVPVHEVEHRCAAEVAPHASPTGQSAATLQPHKLSQKPPAHVPLVH